MKPEPQWTELARRFEAGEIEVEYQYKTSLKKRAVEPAAASL